MTSLQRKNFLPLVLFVLFSWSAVGFFLFFVDPQVIRDFPLPGLYFPFFLVLFLAVFLAASLLLSHVRRGALVATGITVFLLLRIFGLGHFLNAALLASFLLALELAISTR